MFDKIYSSVNPFLFLMGINLYNRNGLIHSTSGGISITECQRKLDWRWGVVKVFKTPSEKH